jgi:hypothetical protein
MNLDGPTRVCLAAVPRWLTSAKNRDEVLRGIRRLKQRLPEQRVNQSGLSALRECQRSGSLTRTTRPGATFLDLADQVV